MVEWYSVDIYSTINTDVIIALSIGICHVLASLPEKGSILSGVGVTYAAESRANVFSCKRQSVTAYGFGSIANRRREKNTCATMLKTFTKAMSAQGESLESGCDTSPDRHTPVQEPVLAIVHKGLSFVVNAAANYCGDEVSMHGHLRHVNHCFCTSSTILSLVTSQNVSTAISSLLSALMPPDYDINGSMTLLKDLCVVSTSMLRTQHGRPVHFESIFEFLIHFVQTHGHKIEKWASESTENMSVNINDKEAARQLGDLMLGTIAATQASLGSV
jgi:hypothetical protein